MCHLHRGFFSAIWAPLTGLASDRFRSKGLKIFKRAFILVFRGLLGLTTVENPSLNDQGAGRQRRPKPTRPVPKKTEAAMLLRHLLGLNRLF